jgi:uncharacterized LabA/DUF88 family protein
MSPSAARVICFIDGSNLFGHLERVFGSGKVRLPELCHRLCAPGRSLVEWRFYAAPVPQGTSAEERDRYAGQQRFFAFVQRHRKGVLRLGRFQRDADGRLHEKGVDVLLAIDLARLAAEDKYDVAVMLSGDADLVPAVELVRAVYRRRVEVALPNVEAYHLRQSADAFREITAELYGFVRLG